MFSFLLLGVTSVEAERFPLETNVSGSPNVLSHEPSIDYIDNDVYVTWSEGTTTSSKILFAKSIDGGATFKSKNIVGGFGVGKGGFSSVIANDKDVYVAWGGNYEIVFAKSTDKGENFKIKRINPTYPTPFIPSSANWGVGKHTMAVDGDNIYITYSIGDVNTSSKVFLITSTDRGESFGQRVLVSDGNPNAIAFTPSISVNDGNVYVAWHDGVIGSGNVYFAKSTNNGKIFDDPLKVSTIGGYMYFPSIASDDKGIYVVWAGPDINNKHDVIFAKSIDNGNSFGPNHNISDSSTLVTFPQIATDGTVIYRVWAEDSIRYAKSIDHGITISKPFLTDHIGRFDWNSPISISDSNLYIAFQQLAGHFGDEIIVVSKYCPSIASPYSSNSNLYVSTENISPSNNFAGPMITEVMVCDLDIKDTTIPQDEPYVTVNNKKLRMVQAVDGNWYGYFADRIQSQIADSTALNKKIASKLPNNQSVGLDFGTFCDPSSAGLNSVIGGSANVDFSDTVGVAIPNTAGVDGTAAHLPISNTCKSGNNLLNNVIKNAKPPVSSSVDLGQINIDTAYWPFIQLYDLTVKSKVVVQYTKGADIQETILVFDTINTPIRLDFDPVRPSGFDVRVNLNDTQLNIDPTTKDSWTWATLDTGSALFYELFDEDGDPTGDGIQTSSQNIIPSLSSMMFVNNGILLLDKDPLGLPVVQLETNGIHTLTGIDGNTIKGGISASDQPVTFIESAKNSGDFINYDMTNDANIDTICNAPNTEYATIDYNGVQLPIKVDNTSFSSTVTTATTSAHTVNFQIPDCSGSFLTSVSAISGGSATSIGTNLPNSNFPFLNVQYPHGFFSWIASVPNLGDEITVEITFPLTVVPNSLLWGTLGPTYWVLVDGIWTDLTSLTSPSITGMTLKIIDGSDGDLDGVQNGQISHISGIVVKYLPRATNPLPGSTSTFENSVYLWANGQIDDDVFIQGIKPLIKKDIMTVKENPKVNDVPKTDESAQQKIPSWIKQNAKWWTDGMITEQEFVDGLEYLSRQGIIRIN